MGSLSRDNIQGFIDGYIYAGGDPKTLDAATAEWMSNHPIYKPSDENQKAILSDLVTYRVSEQVSLAPSKLVPAPVPVQETP